MKVLVIGCGNIGSVAAGDLAKNVDCEVAVADNDEKRAKSVAESIGTNNVSWTKLDASNHGKLVEALKGSDLALGFLPGKLGYGLADAAIAARTDLVDVSFMAENPLVLNNKAVKAGVSVVPDCGLAPGISNFLVGHASSNLDKTQSVHIMVGGLPEKPVPPLGYVITWSPESLIDEYTRETRIVKESNIVRAEVLSGLEEVDFPNVGKLEAFFTDGLRTLLCTISGVKDMWEKTLRYSGHAEKIRVLKDLGFFGETSMDVDGVNVSPRRLMVNLLIKKLWKPEFKDVVVLKVEVSGVKNGMQKRFVYHMLDHYDRQHRITAMARTTAYPASIVAQTILNGAVEAKGVVPPERLGMRDELFRMFCEGLKLRGIKINEEIIED
jgi:lysine 6-dehydrogenase